MQKENYSNLVKNYEKKGTIMVPFSSSTNPLSDEDFSKLKNYCTNVEKEFIEIGDAGEKNHLLVGRFITDVKKPVIVKNKYSKKVISILKKKKLVNFIKKILKTKKNIHLRRVQFNEIGKNCFVGYHLDVDSNPDYLAACVIQLGSKFKGGIYRVYQKKSKKFYDYAPSKGSLIISNCLYPHEVTKVKAGKRGSLVFFVSYKKGLNKRNS
tara:strand:- start:5190 stop:5819 length:630 start_codon:yes stop_codon:yes gene_type:complete